MDTCALQKTTALGRALRPRDDAPRHGPADPKRSAAMQTRCTRPHGRVVRTPRRWRRECWRRPRLNAWLCCACGPQAATKANFVKSA